MKLNDAEQEKDNNNSSKSKMKTSFKLFTRKNKELNSNKSCSNINTLNANDSIISNNNKLNLTLEFNNSNEQNSDYLTR